MANQSTPEYTYEWTTDEQVYLRRFGPNNSVSLIPADLSCPAYREFVESGAMAAPYVEPPPPPELSTEEKVNNMEEGLDSKEKGARKLKDLLQSSQFGCADKSGTREQKSTFRRRRSNIQSRWRSCCST